MKNEIMICWYMVEKYRGANTIITLAFLGVQDSMVFSESQHESRPAQDPLPFAAKLRRRASQMKEPTNESGRQRYKRGLI